MSAREMLDSITDNQLCWSNHKSEENEFFFWLFWNQIRVEKFARIVGV